MKNDEKANNNESIKFEKKNKKEEENSVNELNYHKLQIENAKKDNEILKLREEIQQFKKFGFDTSSSFPWPDEFKNRWETFVRTMIMDNFEAINSNYILLMKTINIIVKIIYDSSKIQIRQKTIELLKCLGLKNISDINISNFYNKFQRLLFQDFFKTLFIVSNEFYDSIITKIKNEIYNNKQIFNDKEIEDILKDLTDKNIAKFIRELFFLCLYMNINEPKLTIKTSTEINYRYYKKNEYDIIEGFGKDNDICIIILNPPMLGYNKPFKGLKPAVSIIENPSKEIIDICERQNNALNNGANIIQNKNYNDIVRIEKVNIGEKYCKNNYNLFNQKVKDSKTFLNNKNINNISSEIKYNSDDNIKISNKNNNDNNYKEKKNVDSLSNKNISKTIKKGDILKIKNSSDYFLKKHIINPINIQKYIKKSEEKKEKIIDKKLKDKLKDIHFVGPQKININYTNKKRLKSSKNNNKKVNKIEIERNSSIEINEVKYNNTETNINMSTPLTNSILDTANNMMKILAMKKKLGLLFYSNTKSQSPSLVNTKNGVSSRTKRRIKQGQVGEFANQLSLERNQKKIINPKEINKKENLGNNMKEIGHERICTEIKKRNNDEKNQILDSIKNNLNERLSYNNNDKRKINDQINSNYKSNNNYIINNNLNDNINNFINTGIIMNSILQNNNNDDEFNKNQKNNFKNINNAYDLNNNLNNKNLYNNKENIKEIKDKYFLRRKINNSISLTRQKRNIDNNININSINNTSNNNNININININNNNNRNDINGNVILNYESDNVIKTEPDKPRKRIEKSFHKIRKNNSKNNASKSKVNINKNIGINSYINKNKIEKQGLTMKNNNTFNRNSNLRTNIPINIDDYINPIISYNYININNSESNCKYTQINIKKNNNNIYKNDLKLKEISKKLEKKNNNAYINLNTDDYIKNKYKYSYHKSMNNFNKNNKKNYSNNDNNAMDNKKKNQKYISYEQFNGNNQINNAHSLGKSKDKLYMKNFNSTFNSNNTINYNEIQNYSLNESSNSFKKFNKKNKNQISKTHNLNNKNSFKDKNKIFLMHNCTNKGSLINNKIKKTNKNVNQCKTNKNEINPDIIKNNNFTIGKFIKDNDNNVYKNNHYKIFSSDEIKNYFFDNYRCKTKSKNNKQANFGIDSLEKIYDQNEEFKHKKNMLTLPND